MTHAGAVIRFFAIGVDSRSADSEQDRGQPIQESRRGLDSRSKHAPWRQGFHRLGRFDVRERERKVAGDTLVKRLATVSIATTLLVAFLEPCAIHQ